MSLGSTGSIGSRRTSLMSSAGTKRKSIFDRVPVAKRPASIVRIVGPVKKTQGVVGSSRAVEFKGKLKRKNGPKKVNVPTKLRKQIAQTLAEKQIKGTYQLTQYGRLDLPADNTQLAQVGVDNYSSSFFTSTFSAQMFLHYASVLWNQKDNSMTGLTSYTGSIAYTDTPGIDYMLPVDQVSSKAITAKFHIINSYEMRTYKNNSDRTVTMEIYQSEPRKPFFENNNELDVNGVLQAENPQMTHPVDYWRLCLLATDKAGGNVANCTTATIHTNPLHLAMFTKAYKSSKLTVTLEPGQKYDHTIQGPKNLDLDYQKFYGHPTASSEAVFQPIQKFTRYVWYVIKQDLAQKGTGKGTPGRWLGVASETATSPNCISYERVIRATMTIPESVGTKLNGVALSINTNVMLQNIARLPKFGFYTFSGEVVGSVRRVDELEADAETV